MVINPPGDSVETRGSGSRWCLATRRGAPGGVCSLVNTKACGAWRQRKSRQAIVAVAVKTKALSAWRYVSPTRRFYYSNLGLLILCAWSTRLLGYHNGRLAGVPWVVAQNNISWVVARDGGWTRGTLELWLSQESLSMWQQKTPFLIAQEKLSQESHSGTSVAHLHTWPCIRTWPNKGALNFSYKAWQF